MTRLSESVDQLLHAHKKTISTPDGIEIHDRPGLLQQLHDAVFGGLEKTGGSGSKAKLPISEAALDLHELIDQQITEAWAAATKRVPGVATPGQMLAEWSRLVLEDSIVVVTRPEQHDRWSEKHHDKVPVVIRVREEHTPAALAGLWVTMIEDFLNPDRTAGIKAPCIQCETEKITRRKDGETVVTDALVFRRDKDTGRTLDARCLACGAMWTPSQFPFLMNALDLDDTPDLEETPRSQAVQWRGSDECHTGSHGDCRMLHCTCECHTADHTPRASAARPLSPVTVMFPSLHVDVADVCGSCFTIRSVSGACVCP